MRPNISTQLNSTENYERRCLTPLSPHCNNILSQTNNITSSDRFPVPVRSAVKSNFTNWRCQNLSERALNALTVHYRYYHPRRTLRCVFTDTRLTAVEMCPRAAGLLSSTAIFWMPFCVMPISQRCHVCEHRSTATALRRLVTPHFL